MLVIKNLSKTFEHKNILDAISLTVNPGEIALLLGRSGVGKSTLLRILNNLESYDSGTIELNNQPLDIKRVNKTHTVGMVFQQFNLFDHLTVERNITLPLERSLGSTSQEAHALAHALLKKYGLEDKAQVYAAQLSGGQKQRLAIARTLALKPVVICLDEPTSALDPFLTNSVAQSIQDLANAGYIVLVASHDTALIDRINCTIYLMNEGKIQESASSYEFLANKNAYPYIKHFVAGIKIE